MDRDELLIEWVEAMADERQAWRELRAAIRRAWAAQDALVAYDLEHPKEGDKS